MNFDDRDIAMRLVVSDFGLDSGVKRSTTISCFGAVVVFVVVSLFNRSLSAGDDTKMTSES